MLRQTLVDGWMYGEASGIAAFFGQGKQEPVMLPHDAMILQERDPSVKAQGATGFFPAGTYAYTRTLDVPEEYAHKAVILVFEGVYTNAMVYINGNRAAQWPYGYGEFTINARPYLRYGAQNEIKIIAKTSTDGDSRWYSGGGLYRPVHLLVSDLLHIAPNGVRITTTEIEGIQGCTAKQALVEVATTVVNESALAKGATLVTELCDGDGHVVASDRTPVTSFAGDSITIRQRMVVSQPSLWSLEAPNLYTCRSQILEGEETLDTDENTFGIRQLQLDALHGLRLNGQEIKLRGACIHHDNGVVGACTYAHLEERRVAIMKAAGFNALRSAHHPMSRALLDACDRLGMLVMDETFDMWTESKTPFDYANYYGEWWERDVEAMVAKDYNHPAVILYSIGNEIQEVGSPHGAALGRRQAEKIRSLDDTRYILNAINAMIAAGDVMRELRASMPEAPATQGPEAGGETPSEASPAPEGSADINALMGSMGEMMNEIVSHPAIGQAIAESAAAVDIVGYNYARSRYKLDAAQYPNRVMVGSETFPADIDLNWALVKELPQLIGDFTWTGWDYLGEAGCGKIDYTRDTSGGIFAAYPWYIAYCGDIDITGHRRPASYYREIVWGLRSDPYLAVQRPEHHGEKALTTPWSWTDSISSWTWPGFEGQPIIVETYADTDEVELLLNGRSLGRAGAGEANRFRAIFETVYEPGELVAVAYKKGVETGRTTLRTAGPELRLDLSCDRTSLKATGADVACLTITLTDAAGTVQTAMDRKVSVTVEGAGTLQGLGSADPTSLENFYDCERTTFDGRALAVVRAGLEPGTITVRAAAEGCPAETLTLPVVA